MDSASDVQSPPPEWLRPVAIIALVWYVFGTFVIVSSRYADPLSLSPVQRAFTGYMPWWAHAAIQLAVTTGIGGAIALLFRHRWALPLMVGTLIGIAVQLMWMFAMADVTSVLGGRATMTQFVVLIVALILVRITHVASQKGWLR